MPSSDCIDSGGCAKLGFKNAPSIGSLISSQGQESQTKKKKEKDQSESGQINVCYGGLWTYGWME